MSYTQTFIVYRALGHLKLALQHTPLQEYPREPHMECIYRGIIMAIYLVSRSLHYFIIIILFFAFA